MNFSPHSGQNFEVAGMDFPHLGQFFVAVVCFSSFAPHSRQNFDVAGIRALQLGQIITATDGTASSPVGCIT